MSAKREARDAPWDAEARRQAAAYGFDIEIVDGFRAAGAIADELAGRFEP